MEPKQWNYLILTLTVAIVAIFGGLLWIERTVIDKNYHEPNGVTATVKAYEDCINNGTAGMGSDEQVKACAKLTGETPAPTPIPTPTVTPGAKK